MALGIEGQFYLNFNIAGNADFIDKDTFVKFTVYEYAGNLLPTFFLAFRTQESNVIRSLNEGNIIQAQMGRTLDTVQDINLSVSSIKKAKDGANFSYFELSGFAGPLNYVTDHQMQITAEMSAIEATILKARENGFVVEGNITSSTDRQKWIQPNISDKAFVNDTYMRAVVPNNSSVALALTADGRFIIKDVLRDIRSRSGNSRFDWKLTKNPQSNRDIAYDADVVLESQAGFINNWLGYGRNLEQIDNVSGKVETIFENPEITLSLSNQLDKLQSVGARYGGSRFKSEAVHDDFWKAHNHNLIFLSNLSKIKLAVSVTDHFFNIRPLDLVMYTEESTTSLDESSEFESGVHIAAGVVRNFEGERMNTTLILNREALNAVRVGA